MQLIELSPEEMEELAALEKDISFRVCKPWWTGNGDLGFPDCRAQGPPK